jgi:hypothetical protein
MLPGTVWGFLTVLLIVLIGAYLLFPDSNWRLPGESSTAVTTLLCAGGSSAPCCDEDHHEHTSALSVTVDRLHNKVNVFLEGEGSANGTIVEDEESHLLFGKKSCDDPPPANADAFTGTDSGTDASTGTSAGTSTGTRADKGPLPRGGTLKGEACKIASGEINRLTGVADITIKDGNGKTVVEWNMVKCERKWRKF